MLRGGSDWIIGEDPNLPYKRSLSNPKSLGHHYGGNCNEIIGQPDTYQGDFWSASSCGFGGVDVNSGVQNYWFYLLANGGNGINDKNQQYNITGISLDNAALITYMNLYTNIQTGPQFIDARAGTIEWARFIFGNCSNEEIQTTNAWNAVGVGSKSACNVTSVPKIQKELQIKVFPNPSSGLITIKAFAGEMSAIKVYALDGKLVLIENSINQYTYNLDLSFLDNGVYLIEVISNGFTTRERIIINH